MENLDALSKVFG